MKISMDYKQIYATNVGLSLYVLQSENCWVIKLIEQIIWQLTMFYLVNSGLPLFSLHFKRDPGMIATS